MWPLDRKKYIQDTISKCCTAAIVCWKIFYALLRLKDLRQTVLLARVSPQPVWWGMQWLFTRTAGRFCGCWDWENDCLSYNLLMLTLHILLEALDWSGLKVCQKHLHCFHSCSLLNKIQKCWIWIKLWDFYVIMLYSEGHRHRWLYSSIVFS